MGELKGHLNDTVDFPERQDALVACEAERNLPHELDVDRSTSTASRTAIPVSSPKDWARTASSTALVRAIPPSRLIPARSAWVRASASLAGSAPACVSSSSSESRRIPMCYSPACWSGAPISRTSGGVRSSGTSAPMVVKPVASWFVGTLVR